MPCLTPTQRWKLKPKPKPENLVLKEILETQTETDTYLAKIWKTKSVFSLNVKTETDTKTCSKFSKVLCFKNCHHHPYQHSPFNAEC